MRFRMNGHRSKKGLRSATILALLLLSGFLSLITLAKPAHSANSSPPTIAVTSGNPLKGGVSQSVAFTIANPASNAFGVTALTVNAPTGWTISAQSSGSFLLNGGFSASTATWSSTSGTGLVPGGSDGLGITLTPPTATYPFSGTFVSSLRDSSGPAFYSGPSFVLLAMNPTTAITTVVVSATSYVAGTTSLTVDVTETPAQADLPIVFTANYPSGTTYGFAPATATTDSTGTATTTFQPSNVAGAVAHVTATVGTSAVTPNSAVVTTLPGPPSQVIFNYSPTLASDGNDYSATSATTSTSPSFTGAEFLSTGVSFSI